MANRKITQMPPIDGRDINDNDLLTLVHTFEVDPTLKNKKITFTQFRGYLDQYYGPASLSGNIVISGSLTITGDLTVEGLNSDFVSGTFASGITVGGDTNIATNLNVVNTISGNNLNGTNANITNVIVNNITGVTFSGIDARFVSGSFDHIETTFVTGTEFRGDAGVFDYVTGITEVSGQTVQGVSGIFTNLRADTVSGATITGEQLLVGTGNFVQLSAQNLHFSGDESISGDLSVSGIVTASGLVAEHEISGETLTVTAPENATGIFTGSGIIAGEANGPIGSGGNAVIVRGPLIILP